MKPNGYMVFDCLHREMIPSGEIFPTYEQAEESINLLPRAKSFLGRMFESDQRKHLIKVILPVYTND